MKSLLELYGQQFRNPIPDADSQDYTTSDVFGQMAQNRRRADYDNSLLGMVHNWATGEQRQPVQLPDNAPLMDQMKEAGMRMLNLPNDMAAGGAKTMAHWLGSAGNPEMVEPLDMLAPLGIGAMAGMAGAVPRGAVGSAGGKLANEALDMSHEARMQRAREMGFDTDTTWYHGTDADIKSFDNSMIGENYQDWSWGHHLTNDPSEAATYGSAIMPSFVKNDGTQFVQNSPGYNASQIADLDRGYLSGKAKTSGATSVRVIGKDGNENMVVLDPRNIRSVNAAFDPAKSDSANLLAADQARASLPGLLAGAADEPRGITAYHGSPHDFDRFSMDKIGTGEGAQAYGHGLYFAENEGVAKSYRDTLTGRIRKGAGSIEDAKAAIAEAVGSKGKIVTESFNTPSGERYSVFEEIKPSGIFSKGERRHIGFIDTLKNTMSDGVQYYPHSNEPGALERLQNPGRMYEVRINADPEDFLDWDKPLSQQGDVGRRAAAVAGPIANGGGDPLVMRGHWKASDIMERARDGGGDRLDVSDRLREAGIPGIRYLDQGSRSAGEGSRNYVVFDDALVEILRKYGLLGMIGGGSLLGSSESEASPAGGLFGVP